MTYRQTFIFIYIDIICYYFGHPLNFTKENYYTLKPSPWLYRFISENRIKISRVFSKYARTYKKGVVFLYYIMHVIYI